MEGIRGSTTGTIGYDVILAIVIIEVLISFSIGVVCILLSFNLFRALKDLPNVYTGVPVGEFPLSRGTSLENMLESTSGDGYSDIADYSTFPPPSQNEHSGPRDTRFSSYGGSEDGLLYEDALDPGEGGADEEQTLWAIARSVAAYIRIW
eukprot:CAMPEP_0174953778 /NCGR_PEP_ID=MMETSP0004_2-20121128/46_1 /TAXON_ID=420556 /ORGANISM="Ochromonas sp., Strain CCMP1393" /LENGTH=149 /DNA_ID=CAMNT_0016201495 /DNA_START=50 /DNA_END=499 /DNA_ORIENTATION=+